MPDIGFLELLLVGVIAFLVLGPERMPELFGQAGRVVRKGRDWLAKVKQQIDAESALLTTPVTEIKDALSEGDISSINEEIMKKHGQRIDPAIAQGSSAASEDDDKEEADIKKTEAER